MSVLNVTDRVIQGHATDITTYSRGHIYYLNKRVNSLHFLQDDLTFHAKVRGNDIYDVSVSFSEDGNITSSSCTCPAFSTYSGACKHIVAVLKLVQEKSESINVPVIQNKRIINDIFTFFQGLEHKTKQEVKLEITYTLQAHYGSLRPTIELRMGLNKLYIVKNIKKFIEQTKDFQPSEFGKNFTFDPGLHTFSASDKAVMDLFDEIYENEAALENSSPYHNGLASAFKGKELYLTQPVLKRLFSALTGNTIKANIFGDEGLSVTILEQDLPLVFTLKQNNDDLLLGMNLNKGLVSLTDSGEYFYYLQNIYKVSETQKRSLLPLLKAFTANRQSHISFSPSQKGRFVSEILPHIQDMGKVSIDEAVEKSFYREDLQAKIYFDKHKDGISAIIEFHYGEEQINPFFGEKPQKESDNRILIRDVEKERKFISLFERAEFKVERGKVYLLEEDKIFEFINEILPELKELAEIYYSDDFRNIKMRNSYSYSGRVRLNETSNILEFSFEFDDIDKDELENIFASLKIKKRYYRLKDGSFMPLNSAELENMAQLIDHLDISAKDLRNNVIELPKYRAMYIDNMLRESRLSHIEKNLAFKQMVQNIREPEDMEFEIPEGLEQVLRDYQKIGFKWLKTLSYYGLGGILADDMGLGKTLQVITFVLSEKPKGLGPSLVIAPTSLLYNWKDEVEKFVSHMKITVVSGSQKTRQEQMQDIQDSDIIITSYPLIRRDIDIYQEIDFAYCFIDEAQHIKNPATINAKSVKQIKAKGYFALTGTPIENSLTELWSIFDFVMPGYLLAHTKFVQKYENPIAKNQDSGALKELGRHIRPFVLRRMKKDVLKELPEKIETRMSAEMTPEQKKIYVAYLQKARGEIAQEIAANGFEKSQIKILAALTRLRQLCCHPSLFIDNFEGDSGKILLLQEIMEDALDSGHRILLFSQFTSMLGIIKQNLEKQNIEHFYLDGSTKAEERSEMVKAFNNGSAKMFLISLKAGGTGLNLTGADMVIHYDPWWNPAVEDQATDRAYRIGQKNMVQVMKLITKGTIEEKIYELQQKKKKLIDSVIQPGETLLTKMKQEDIMQLFEL